MQTNRRVRVEYVGVRITGENNIDCIYVHSISGET